MGDYGDRKVLGSPTKIAGTVGDIKTEVYCSNKDCNNKMSFIAIKKPTVVVCTKCNKRIEVK